MAVNINNVSCKLIGISCLEDDIRTRVQRAWDNRFQKHNTFWVDIDKKDQTVNIARKIALTMAQHGIEMQLGQTVVLAVFMDLTKNPDPNLLDEIAELPDKLNRALGCNVPVTLTFADLGEMAFAENQGQLRSYVATVVDGHKRFPDTRKQLVLVAKPPLALEENDKSWKAVMVLLDVLRRTTDPAGMLPVAGGDDPNNDVGFLRYGEYDEVETTKLNTELASIEVALGNGGETELHEILLNKLSLIDEEIRSGWEVDGNLQPIHPGMIVEGRLARSRARKGRNAQFEEARNATWTAIEATGRHMREDIRAAYAPLIQKAEILLDTYIQQAGVGVELEENTVKMQTALSVPVSRPASPEDPVLAYSENGYANEIGCYLQATRENASYEVKRKFVDAILAAYNNRPKDMYINKKRILKERKDEINRQLSKLMKLQELIDKSAQGRLLPETSFNPGLGGGNQCRFMLCRKYDAEADAACLVTATNVFFIDSVHGGLKYLDNAPVKSIQLLMFNCDPVRLDDLIK